MTDTLKLTPTETVTIKSRTPDVLEVEARYGPAGKPPPAHYHPDQDEHFRILEGRMQAKVDGEHHELGLGDTLEIPRRAAHQMWNPSDEPARLLWQTRPAGRTEEWFRSIDRLLREADERGDATPDASAFVELLSEFDDTFQTGC